MTNWLDLGRSVWYRALGFTESTLVVIVREAGPLKQLVAEPDDTDLPAHVTVWYPVPRAGLSPAWRRKLAAVFTGEFQFDATLDSVHLFESTASATPTEPAPFRALSAAVQAHLPVAPMYGGSFSDFIPHLTLGPRSALTPDKERDVEAALPFIFRVTGVELWGQRDRRWEHIETFRLAPTTEPSALEPRTPQ